MKQVLKYTGYILVILLIGFLIWRFYYLITWVLAAVVVSFIGQPLVRFFDKIHIRKLKIPHSLSAILALAVILLVILGLIAVFVPMIVNQAEAISKIDVNRLALNFQEPIGWIDDKMHDLGAIPAGQTMQDFLIDKAKSVVNLGNVSSLIGKLISEIGNILIGLFSILFTAFFFLKDENMFEKTLLLFIPEKNHEATHTVFVDSKHLLVRYFIGVFLEVLVVMLLIALGLWILGVKNALLLGFFGGIMNIIPYLGPIIGTSIGITLGITSTLASGSFNELLPVICKLAGVFIIVNFIDNNILVPSIYSRSVKSHPLEIFLVIIIGGGIAGLVGMLLAVPVYTLLRVIAKEFFIQFRVVKKLTDSMN